MLPSTTGLYIEFVGPSGIGKSTCFGAFTRIAKGNWNFREQISMDLIQQSEDILDGSLHWKLLFYKSNFVHNMNLNGFRKIKLMIYFNQIINQDFFIFNSPYDSGFMLDEGLCHNFSKQLNEFDSEDFVQVMNGRALVFIHAKNPLTVVERIRKRQRETGAMVTHHIGLSDEDLKGIVIQSQANFAALKERFKKYSLPYCELVAEDDMDQKMTTLLDFESHLLLPRAPISV